MSDIKVIVSTNILPVEIRDIPSIMKGDKGDKGADGRDGSYVQKAYKTYASMVADKGNIPTNTSVLVNNDPDKDKNAYYTYDGTEFTKSDFDPQGILTTVDVRLNQAVESASEYFQSQVADTVATTIDNSTIAYNQAIEVTKGQWANTISATDADIRANSEAYLATIPGTVNEAINNTAIEGGVLADTFVVVDGNQTQRELNQKTTRTFKKIADLVADTKLKNGQYVNTLSYNTTGDGGGAFYLVSNTATDYSIPLANNLHAVFSDMFDIRKFGIVDNATLNQDVELLRMRNYADSREYTIDFHNYSIMNPNLDAGMVRGGAFALVRGLWFDNVHHIKNLKIYSDKVNRQVSGQCNIVFCPTKDVEEEQWFVFENVTLDPWSDNYQPFTDNYVGTYDGMRHGIFVHPKGGWNAIFSPTQEDYATNYSFKFINMDFLSSAYSYNITTAGIRARRIEIDGYKGDSILAFNTDAVELRAKNFTTNTRFDLVEEGRLMVSSGIHYESEHSDGLKDGLIFNHKISLENCHITKTSKLGVKVASGQLLWFTALGLSDVSLFEVDNCSGNIEVQGTSVKHGRDTLIIDVVDIRNCKDHIWFGTSRKCTIKSMKVTNSIIGKKTINNSYIFAIVDDATINRLEVKDSYYTKELSFGGTNGGKVKELVLDNINLDMFETNVSAFCSELIVNKLTLRNSVIKTTEDKSIFRDLVDVFELDFDNVTLVSIVAGQLFNTRYTEAIGETEARIKNLTFVKDVAYDKFNLSGSITFTGLDTKTLPDVALPIRMGTFTAGTNTVTVKMDKVVADKSLNKAYALTGTIEPSAVLKETYPVVKDCKDIGIELSVDLGVSVSKYRTGDNYIVIYKNDTAEAITMTSTVLVRQIV